MESITIPENITNIEHMAFHYCTNLESINVDVNNNIYSSIDGVLFNKEQDKIIFFPYNKSDSYEIRIVLQALEIWLFTVVIT